MRYYTKEWYDLTLKAGVSDYFRRIPDQERFTDEDLERIYQWSLAQEIAEEEAFYNEPPELLAEDEIPDGADFDPEDYLVADLDENGEETDFRHPASREEFLAYLASEQAREMAEFQARPPFDPAETIELFRESYEDGIAEPDPFLPDWLYDKVDRRLIAMRVLPAQTYDKLHAEDTANLDRLYHFQEWIDEADEIMAEEIPPEILDGFSTAACGNIAGILRAPESLTLLFVDPDGEDGPVGYEVVFEDARILEDEGATVEAGFDEDGDFYTSCDLIAWEIFRDEDGFAFHLFFDSEGQKYLTLTARTVRFGAHPVSQ